MRNPKNLIIAVSGRQTGRGSEGKREKWLDAGSFEVGIFCSGQYRGRSRGRRDVSGARIRGGHCPLDGEALDANLATSVHRHQGGNWPRVKALAGKILNDFQRLFRSVRMLIWTIRGQSIKRIGHGDHASQQRNLLSLEAVGIAAAIESFVM